jgi:ribosome maturation factor RimP
VGVSPHIFYFSELPPHVSAELEAIVTQELGPLGFELVDLRVGGSRSRPTLQVRIDRTDEERVTVEDCARASRAIEARLDSGGPLGERYGLEVSSPGVERQLRSVAEWRRFEGRKASVVSDALGGRAEVEILAVEGDAGREQVRVRMQRGEERSIALAEVREARLVFNWK